MNNEKDDYPTCIEELDNYIMKYSCIHKLTRAYVECPKCNKVMNTKRMVCPLCAEKGIFNHYFIHVKLMVVYAIFQWRSYEQCSILQSIEMRPLIYFVPIDTEDLM